MKTLKDNRIAMLTSSIPTLQDSPPGSPRHADLARLYNNRKWTDRTRPAVLRLMPICCRCRRARSEIADHVIPRTAPDPVADHDIANLQGLCKPCHLQKGNDLHTYNRPMSSDERATNARDWRNADELQAIAYMLEDAKDIGC